MVETKFSFSHVCENLLAQIFVIFVNLLDNRDENFDFS